MLLGRGVKRVCRFLHGAPVLKQVNHGASFQSVAVAVPAKPLEAIWLLRAWCWRSKANKKKLPRCVIVREWQYRK